MHAISLSVLATWIVAGLATAAVIVRPWRLPEAIWAVTGATILVVAGLLPFHEAIAAVAEGGDVYLFLVGMMLLSEVARREQLFDWLAVRAVRMSGGSSLRLFGLIYGVGTVVTAFLSNDATAVVLTPAVFAATRAAEVEPLPFLLICAFIANAASFILPISNPANLVLYASRMPPLASWIGHFILPAALSVAATFIVLLLIERSCLRRPVRTDVEQPSLPGGGVVAAIGIALTGLVLLGASALGLQLGLPTALAGLATAALVWVRKRESPLPTLRGVSWEVLPLVAGLFVLVAGLRHTGLVTLLAQHLHRLAQTAPEGGPFGAGAVLAVLCNVMNNLPAGLLAGSAVQAGHLPQPMTDALLIGVDLGPNLSITGSLATILWLSALRREGLEVSFGRFLSRGALVMPPALLLALAGLLLL
ncbi:arsenic transporter [Rhizosaccharibacter radicis]|uniref:Arsenic transporter n=1 Tax=Rhizosaccharibacter radicis TaxID=2782605 RepID=A0ABT1W1U0_9PROT|nr:arsenic transporter [Acetobacteraceae bacterium KSS12]